MSSSVDNYLDKIITLIKQKTSQNHNLTFPCKYMIFHQAKSYCKDCDDFICNKCIQKHDKFHKILSLEETIDLLNSNITLYKNLSNGKFPKEEKQKTEGIINKINLDETIEQSFIEEIDNLINKLTCTKKKILKMLDTRKNILNKYNSEENKNIVYDDSLMQNILKQEKFEMKPLNIKEVKEIHDIIKFEKNNTTLFKTFFSFCNDLDNKNKDIINNNKYINKLKKKDSMSVFERINLKTNELNLIMTDSFNHKIKTFLGNEIPCIDDKIEKTQEVFKNSICSFLKVEDEEYLKEMEKTEIKDETKKVVEKIVEIPKEVIIEKKVEVKVPITKNKFEKNELKIQSKEKLNIYGIINKKEDLEKNKIEENKEIKEEKEEIKEVNKEDIKEDNGEINLDSEEIKKDKNEESENEEENEESDDILSPNDNIFNQNQTNKPKITGLKRATIIKKKTEIDSYSVSILSTKSMKEVYMGTYNESKGIFIIRDNKYLMETDEEVEITTKSCYAKLKEMSLLRVQKNFDLDKELSKFTWKERNIFELLYPVEDKKLICIYNPYINKVEEIEMEISAKFPINCAMCFKLPYCFISGGKILNEDEELQETNSFYSLRREGPKIFEKMVLPEMLEEKSDHCLFEVPYTNSLCSLGGNNSKDVEMFDLEEKNWKKYPDLNYPRKNASCCVVNNTFIYCFFGYDEENSAYLTSIEKYDIVYGSEWEVLNPYGNKTFMKKRMSSCVKYRQNFEENIYIVGGINILNKESNDVLVYDEKHNTIEKEKEMILPYKSRFNSSSFIQLFNGIFYNLDMDSQLIQYESSGKYFFGIREKEI